MWSSLQPTWIEILGASLFGLAVMHTFLVKKILDFSHRFKKGSTLEILFHFLGEIEVVFGIWAALLFIVMGLFSGFSTVIDYQEKLHFTEPIFVFCIMVVSATKPVLWSAQKLIETVSHTIAKVTKLPQLELDILTLFILGPLSGSFITEPAAMTVTALLLSKMIHKIDLKLMYFLLAILFVNVSIGGALTPYAAPPILMVANTWGWDLSFVFKHFGVEAMLAVSINALILVLFFRSKLKSNLHTLRFVSSKDKIPISLVGIHLLFLFGLVVTAHYPKLCVGLLLFFLGLTAATPHHQMRLRLKESLLVAFFLAGIIVFGPLQSWWLTPILKALEAKTLFVGATLLTAITDNAALTYLGSQVEGLSEASKFFLVAGAITGGGLTIIANAPNAAGFSILQDRFPGGVHPGKLLISAIVPTLVAFICLYLGS